MIKLIIGMTLVTYLPRLIPLMFLTDRPLHPAIKKFLSYIPYTSLSILIIRGIIGSSPDMVLASIGGILMAGIMSFINGNLVLSILASIFTSFIILQFIQ